MEGGRVKGRTRTWCSGWACRVLLWAARGASRAPAQHPHSLCCRFLSLPHGQGSRHLGCGHIGPHLSTALGWSWAWTFPPVILALSVSSQPPCPCLIAEGDSELMLVPWGSTNDFLGGLPLLLHSHPHSGSQNPRAVCCPVVSLCPLHGWGPGL